MVRPLRIKLPQRHDGRLVAVDPGNVKPVGDYSRAVPDAGSSSSATPPPDAPLGAGTTRRAKDRRRAAPLAKIGMIVFAIGLIAVFADMILFAAGSRNLPLWINLTAMLAPVGLGLGLIGVVRENRQASPALVARKAAAKQR